MNRVAGFDHGQSVPYRGRDIVMPSSKGDAPATKVEIKEYFAAHRAARPTFLEALVEWAEAINARY